MPMDVDFWVDNNLEGYVTDFVVDTITSYSEGREKISKDPRKVFVILENLDKYACM